MLRARHEPNDRDVGQRVRADKFRFNLTLVCHCASEVFGVPGDMVVGDHVAARGDNHPTADGLPLDLPSLLIVYRYDADPDQRWLDRGHCGVHRLLGCILVLVPGCQDR